MSALESMGLIPVVDADVLVAVRVVFYGAPGVEIHWSAKAIDELIAALVDLRNRHPNVHEITS